MKILFECSGIIPGTHCGTENFIYSIVRGLSTMYPQDEIYMNITPGLKSEFENVLPDVNVIYLEDIKRYRNQNNYKNNLFVNYFVRGMRRIGLHNMVSGYNVPRSEWCKQCEELVDVILYPSWGKCVHFNKPVVMVIHDLRHFLRGKEANENKKIVATSPARCLVTSWPEPYRHITELFPERKSHSFMVPFQFEPMPSNDELSQNELNRLLVYASSNGLDKNHENLILALGILKRAGVAPVKIICPGHQLPARTALLTKLVHDENVEDWIQFLGFVPRQHVKWLYQICSAVITTTKYEAFSGTVLEAFQYAKPVACSRISSLTSVIDSNNINVRYFDPDKPKEIADAIIEIINNPTPYKEGALHAHRIFSRITPERTAQMYHDVLAWACGQADKPVWKNHNSLMNLD